jgi:hypothetical protein
MEIYLKYSFLKNNPQGLDFFYVASTWGEANFDNRGMINIIFVEDYKVVLHAKYLRY